MTNRYKLMCGCECCIYSKIMHLSLLTCHDFNLKHLKGRSHNAQNRRSGESSSRIFEPIKLCNSLWVSYLQFWCWNGYANNLSLYLTPSWANTLEMCIYLLWEMPRYYYNPLGDKQRHNKHVFNNNFKCLLPCITL